MAGTLRRRIPPLWVAVGLALIAWIALAAVVLSRFGGPVLVVSQPTVVGEATGVVTVVNQAGSALCLSGPGSGDEPCSNLLMPMDGAAPAVGDTVSVWIVRVPLADGSMIDTFVLRQ